MLFKTFIFCSKECGKCRFRNPKSKKFPGGHTPPDPTTEMWCHFTARVHWPLPAWNGKDPKWVPVQACCAPINEGMQIFDFLLPLFVRRAHTQATKDWLNVLEKENVPVLICLSFADKLYAELMGEEVLRDVKDIKTDIQTQLEVRIVNEHVKILAFFIYPSIYPSIHASIHSPTQPPTYPPIHPCTHPFIQSWIFYVRTSKIR